MDQRGRLADVERKILECSSKIVEQHKSMIVARSGTDTLNTRLVLEGYQKVLAELIIERSRLLKN